MWEPDTHISREGGKLWFNLQLLRINCLSRFLQNLTSPSEIKRGWIGLEFSGWRHSRSAENQFPIFDQLSEPFFTLSRVLAGKNANGLTLMRDRFELFWHFGQLMNGSVWWAMSWKINSHQLRKNSHGKLFIISLTNSHTEREKKRVRLSEKKLSSRWTHSLSACVVVHSHSLDSDCHPLGLVVWKAFNRIASRLN